jgi:hypothetical protein
MELKIRTEEVFWAFVRILYGSRIVLIVLVSVVSELDLLSKNIGVFNNKGVYNFLGRSGREIPYCP